MIKINRPNSMPLKTPGAKGVQFLNLSHVPEKGMTTKVTKVTTNKPDNYGNPYVVYYEGSDGTKYSKGYSETSDALATLVDLFGEDEKKWIGKSVLIGKSTDPEQGTRLTYAKG